MKLGIRLESLGLPLRRALAEAQKMGVPGVQFDAVGDLAPKNLSQTGRRELRNLLRAHSLELTAIGAPMRRGFDLAENLQARIDHVREVMAFSFEMGPRIVIVEPGRLPADDSTATPHMHEALLALGQHGNRVGSTLALETGLEGGEALANFLASFDTGGLGVNYDPANLLMHGHDPYIGLRSLVGKIVHAHAKDARAVSPSRDAAEVPLGHGDIEWMRLLAMMEEVEYRDWLVVERESGDRHVADVAAGVQFLRRLCPF